MNNLPERLRAAANAVRTKSMPLSDFIPLLQQAADALDAQASIPPPECKTEAEKTAFTFGWYRALEAQRAGRVIERS